MSKDDLLQSITVFHKLLIPLYLPPPLDLHLAPLPLALRHHHFAAPRRPLAIPICENADTKSSEIVLMDLLRYPNLFLLVSSCFFLFLLPFFLLIPVVCAGRL